MRRLLGLSLVILLSIPALVAGAETTHESVADRFDTVSYSGNNGSQDWSGPWVEVGESDGPEAGQIKVTDGSCAAGKCLSITGGLLSEMAVIRPADLSEFLDARLTYFVHLDPAPLSTGTLYAEVRGNGSGWQTLASYALLTDTGTHQESIDISAYRGSDFRLRFRLRGLTDGLVGTDTVYIDDVMVAGDVAVPTTTTSSTTSSTTSGSGGGGTSQSSSTTSSTTTTTNTPPENGSQPSHGGSRVVGSETTSTTAAGEDGEDEAAVVGGGTSSPPPAALRAPGVGVMADHRPGLLGDLDTGAVEVLSVELDADFSLAAEVFEEAKIWISLLGLLIAAAVIGGMDRRHSHPSSP